MTSGGVTLTAVGVGSLPLVVRRGIVGIAGIRRTHVVHLHIAGQVAQIVHNTVDTEVVAVALVRIVSLTGRRIDLH